MNEKVYVFDPTTFDVDSKVRGIGRYLQIMKEHLGDSFTFTGDLKSIPRDSVLINPFIDLLKPQLINKRYARKQIGIIHDLIPLKYPHQFPIGLKGKIKLFFRKRVLKNYDLFITDSIASKGDIVKVLKIPENKIQIIYPTVTKLFMPHLTYPPDENTSFLFRKENNLENPTFTPMKQEQVIQNAKINSLTNYVLYTGDATWNKNLPMLAQAIKTANVTCVCVGKVFETTDPKKLTHPWMRDLKYFLNAIKDNPLFVILGYVSDLELTYLYRNAKVNILVSHDEGFGFSYIEAGIFSTPTVLSDIPVFREIAQDAALFAKPNDPVDIAKKIVELFFDAEKREVYSIKSFTRAEDFSPEMFRKAWLKLIENPTAPLK